MALTIEQIQIIDSMNAGYIQMFTEYGKNSRDFDQNIQALKSLKELTQKWLEFCKTYLSSIAELNNYSNSALIAFYLWKKTAGIKGDLQLAYERLNNQELKDLTQRIMANSPVIHLNYVFNQGVQNTNNQLQINTETKVETYTLKFYDGSNLEWHSLEDLEEMKKIREIFTQKMLNAPEIIPKQQQEVVPKQQQEVVPKQQQEVVPKQQQEVNPKQKKRSCAIS
jgi:hypothetical protein